MKLQCFANLACNLKQLTTSVLKTEIECSADDRLSMTVS